MIASVSPKDTSLKVCEIYQGGEAVLAKILQVINESMEVIHLQFYIYREDGTGKQVQEALVNASKRGVKIFMVLDGIGSRPLSTEFIKVFRDAGISLHFFSPIQWTVPFRMGRRLHQK